MPAFDLELGSVRGLTHVLDKGLGPRAWEDVLETAGDYIDIVKLGWGTAYVTANLERKLEVLAGKPVVIGGTFFEVAYLKGRLDGYRSWLEQLGLRYVEISDGTVTIPRERKLELIADFSRDFTVLSEVGAKDSEVVYAPEQWVSWIGEELDAGAWKVVTEGREGGTAGVYRPSGEMRTGLVEEIVHHIDPAVLIFEAPTKASQAWFIKRFGPTVNRLARNIAGRRGDPRSETLRARPCAPTRWSSCSARDRRSGSRPLRRSRGVANDPPAAARGRLRGDARPGAPARPARRLPRPRLARLLLPEGGDGAARHARSRCDAERARVFALDTHVLFPETNTLWRGRDAATETPRSRSTRAPRFRARRRSTARRSGRATPRSAARSARSPRCSAPSPASTPGSRGCAATSRRRAPGRPSLAGTPTTSSGEGQTRSPTGTDARAASPTTSPDTARASLQPAARPRLRVDRMHALHAPRRRARGSLGGAGQDRVRPAPLGRDEGLSLEGAACSTVAARPPIGPQRLRRLAHRAFRVGQVDDCLARRRRARGGRPARRAARR